MQTSTLRPVQRERMLDGLQQLHFPEGPKAELERFLRESQEWFARTAPSEIREMIWTWRRNPDRPGVLMIDGFGVDPDLPPTPIDGRRSAAKLTTYSEQVLAGVAMCVGEPISFASERNGTLFTDLSPVKGKENANEVLVAASERGLSALAMPALALPALVLPARSGAGRYPEA
jgi:hypothetical protein